MLHDLTLLIVTTFLTFLLYPFWIRFLYKYKMGEKIRKGGPKIHLKKQGTPTMGGLVFVVSVALITFFFNRSREQTILPLFVATLAGGFGLLEDFSKLYKQNILANILPIFRSRIHENPIRKFVSIFGSKTEKGEQDSFQKLLIQGSIGGFVAYWTYFKLGWDYIWLPLIGNIHIGLMYPIFIILLFLLILNCVAFTDGLDGLLGGLSLIAFVAWWVIARQLDYYSLAGFNATFIGALIAFLYFNINPARIFMGNVGSHVLGASMAIIAIVMHREIALLIIGAVFLFDGISSPLQSFSKKVLDKKIFKMAPIHHHFELLGWEETKIVFRFWLFGIAFAFAGILTALL